MSHGCSYLPCVWVEENPSRHKVATMTLLSDSLSAKLIAFENVFIRHSTSLMSGTRTRNLVRPQTDGRALRFRWSRTTITQLEIHFMVKRSNDMKLEQARPSITCQIFKRWMCTSLLMWDFELEADSWNQFFVGRIIDGNGQLREQCSNPHLIIEGFLLQIKEQIPSRKFNIPFHLQPSVFPTGGFA